MMHHVFAAIPQCSPTSHTPDKPLPSDEEGGIRLPNSPVPGDSDDVSMLDTQIPGAVRTKRPKRKGCCICCGLE